MNRKYSTVYLVKQILISICLLIGGLIASKVFGHIVYFKHLVFLVSLFFIVNGLFHFILVRSSYERPVKFIRTFMIISVVKILIYISLLIIYILNLKFGLKFFLLSFLLTYLSFTIFEVLELSKILKNSNTE
jgi:hypothetical protein